MATFYSIHAYDQGTGSGEDKIDNHKLYTTFDEACDAIEIEIRKQIQHENKTEGGSEVFQPPFNMLEKISELNDRKYTHYYETNFSMLFVISLLEVEPSKKSEPNMNCRRCRANLDDGDVYEVMLQQYDGDKSRALNAAKAYGWSETNKIRANKSIIVQSDEGEQWEECPFCKGKNPLAKHL